MTTDPFRAEEEPAPVPETIAAPAGGEGGALNVVRVSGPAAWDITDRIFRPSGRTRPRRMIRGDIFDPDSGEKIDLCQAVYYAPPASYTGEEMTEIFCHGGRVNPERVLSAVFAAGACPARRGEFTRRAFVNGKMDLTAAEAVAELIGAESEDARRAALRQLEGSVSSFLDSLRGGLRDILVKIEAALQYPEDDPGELEGREIADCIEGLFHKTDGALRRAERMDAVRKGFSVVLTGRTNAGKSSLFNRICLRERSVVSAEPATTRDVVTERIFRGGQAVLLSDTAGFGPEGSGPDRSGRRMTEEAVAGASLILYVLDASRLREEEDRFLLERLREMNREAEVLIVLNKADLAGAEEFSGAGMEKRLRVSALTGEGCDNLFDEIFRIPGLSRTAQEDGFLLSVRAREGLSRVRDGLERIRQDLKKREFLDTLSEEIREVLAEAEGVTGRSAPEDILDAVFERFCLGK